MKKLPISMDSDENDENMVELEGLKPSTSSMPWKHSNQLSYSPILPIITKIHLYF